MKIWKISMWGKPWLLALMSIALLAPNVSVGAEPPSEAAVTLRDILMAACSHNAAQFKGHLTARNAAAFTKLTPAAQMTLLKRFVLLDNAGAPNAELNEKGEITVNCVTEQVTTQMLIGKAEIQENLAFLPLVVRESSDTEGTSARRIQMGLVRESGEWKLLSLGLLLLDLRSLGEEWDRAEIDSNEKLAVTSMKDLRAAIEKYRVTYTRLPGSLSELGPPSKGTTSIDEAGLVSAELASGQKDGYTFRYVIVGANNSGAPAKYELAGMPVAYGRTGMTSYFLDSSGTLHSGDHKGAVGTAADPKMEQ